MTTSEDPGVELRLLERPLTRDEAVAIASWSYDPPYDVYDTPGEDAVQTYMRQDSGYYPVYDGEELVGFVCLGAEARVAGQVVEAGTCDLGTGVRPDRVSRGVGTRLMPLALDLARRLGTERVRAVVASFNTRSLRLCTSSGFVPVRDLDTPDGRRFVELVLDLRSR